MNSNYCDCTGTCDSQNCGTRWNRAVWCGNQLKRKGSAARKGCCTSCYCFYCDDFPCRCPDHVGFVVEAVFTLKSTATSSNITSLQPPATGGAPENARSLQSPPGNVISAGPPAATSRAIPLPDRERSPKESETNAKPFLDRLEIMEERIARLEHAVEVKKRTRRQFQ